MNQNLTEGRGIKTWLLLDLLIGWKTTFVRLLIYGFLIIIYFAWMDCCSAPLYDFVQGSFPFVECIEISRFPKESDAMLNFLKGLFCSESQKPCCAKSSLCRYMQRIVQQEYHELFSKEISAAPCHLFLYMELRPLIFFFSKENQQRKERYIVSMSVRVKKLFQSFNLLRKK